MFPQFIQKRKFCLYSDDGDGVCDFVSITRLQSRASVFLAKSVEWVWGASIRRAVERDQVANGENRTCSPSLSSWWIISILNQTKNLDSRIFQLFMFWKSWWPSLQSQSQCPWSNNSTTQFDTKTPKSPDHELIHGKWFTACYELRNTHTFNPTCSDIQNNVPC